MSGEIDFRKSVYELANEHPEVISILKELGFEKIGDKGMLNTAGRFMTIPKGAAMKGISMEGVARTFRDKGYKVIGEGQYE